MEKRKRNASKNENKLDDETLRWLLTLKELSDRVTDEKTRELLFGGDGPQVSNPTIPSGIQDRLCQRPRGRKKSKLKHKYFKNRTGPRRSLSCFMVSY